MIAVAGFVLLAGLAQAGEELPVVTTGDWVYTPSGADSGFVPKLWKETLVNGQEGHIGNILTAEGQGFSFDNASLLTMNSMSPTTFVTTYAHGSLKLDASGPWMKSGVLNIDDVTAVNTATKNFSTGYLKCEIWIVKRFRDGNGMKKITIIARWAGIPKEKYSDSGITLFRMGSGLDYCEVTIE
jgi:hypothetical protein